MRHGLPLLSALVVLTATGVGCATPGSPPANAAASLASTPLVTLDGTATDLAAVLRGRVAVISLWATWCEACVTEMEALERLHAQSGARADAIVVGVAVGERRETVAAFTRGQGVAYAQLVDEDFRLADALGQDRVPTTLVVDHSGRIVFRGGALDAAGLAAFRKALSASP